ncbi:DUF6777 domain-containing protein [Streptomyces sp. NPDC047014]|uniref:DUF6777 domain-containing protein n=1 Tax=Streptomyces sp. NPDC047014 TaxID=3155736 RepID=UPI0033FE7248
MAAVVALVVVLTRPSGTSDKAGGEVFLQPAAATGPDPFTESTVVTENAPPPESPLPTPTGGGALTASPTEGTPTGTRSISGAAPGVYEGTRDAASCDIEKQIKVLSAEPAKNSAFASALGIQPAAVPSYLRSLTAVQLRMDTRVTNHGFQDGKATSYQAVLQAGTAVLVDDRGVPRVRCACGNPLGPPVPLKADPKRFGQTWPSYRPAEVVVIAPAVKPVTKIVIYDRQTRGWYERDKGQHQHGRPDRPIPPPVIPTPRPTGPQPTKPVPSGTSPRPSDTKSPPPSPTPSGSASPSKSPSTSPSESPSTSPSTSPTPSGSASPSKSPSGSPTPSPSASPSKSPSGSPTPSPSASPSKPPPPSASPTPTASAPASPTSAPASPSGSPSRVTSAPPPSSAPASPSPVPPTSAPPSASASPVPSAPTAAPSPGTPPA